MVEMILAVFGGGDGEGDDRSEHGGRRVRCSRCLRVKAAYRFAARVTASGAPQWSYLGSLNINVV